MKTYLALFISCKSVTLFLGEYPAMLNLKTKRITLAKPKSKTGRKNNSKFLCSLT